MRVLWGPLVPALMRHYGLMPWQLDRLSFDELSALRRDLKTIVEGG